MAFVYFLYSEEADRYYIGSTKSNPDFRLEQHHKKFYGRKKFTAKYNDWKLLYYFECESLSQARKIEYHIKRMKSRQYLKNLQRYSEMREKLKAKYRQ